MSVSIGIEYASETYRIAPLTHDLGQTLPGYHYRQIKLFLASFAETSNTMDALTGIGHSVDMNNFAAQNHVNIAARSEINRAFHSSQT